MAYGFPKTLVKLASITASNSATISFTSAINSNFSTYLVKIRAMIPVTNATNLLMLFSTNNGSGYLSANYAYTSGDYPSTGVASFSSSQSAANLIVAAAVENTSTTSFNGDIEFFDLNSSTFSPKYMGQCGHIKTTATILAMCAGQNTTTTPVNAIQFSMSSGNISSGTFTIYGVSEP